MDFPFIYGTMVRLLGGLPLTIVLSGGAICIGAVLGLILALLRLSGNKILSLLSMIYTQSIRSVPLLVLLFLIYYGLSQFQLIRGNTVLWAFFREPFWCALLAMSINASAYAAEIIRAGLLSVPDGEVEAGRSVGMSGVLLYRRCILPAAIRQALPAYGNEVVTMIKATSLASLVTLYEITGIASEIASQTYRPVEVFVGAGFIYLAINFTLTQALLFIEEKLTPDRKGDHTAKVSPMSAA
ncbi:ABC transporter permease subunit [Mesorhizobium sp. M7D.F.Ca.US.004.03.1.1]|uniref:ABC transporter permease n=1 Tax=Mesorhizobium sp. M7D.F.Ca.US.004.03.1.1 TaxID=2496702 RepID=UPI000FCAD05B|nr:ABC transporter permease subunit [Mesorhizobium sp. M7D.F.Ca.US.004.03.1.1]RVA21933.1 ABC transporter permease subunit [Mesorhizobium sp. M7D.F.Ca.US.004.03.1.1]